MAQFPEINQFLGCKTPDHWVEVALQNQDIMLIDHANCEKKAAAAALHLMHRYVERPELLQKMARLAREELLHFQKVLSLMSARNISYRKISASRYAQALRDKARKQEPDRLVDTLIIGAFIEARSCERFEAIAPKLDEELQKFYVSLLRSERRHYQDYLRLAALYSPEPIDARIEFFRELEKELIESPDDVFRFHSGVLHSFAS